MPPTPGFSDGSRSEHEVHRGQQYAPHSFLILSIKLRAAHVITGTNFTIAEETLLLLGLQVEPPRLEHQNLKRQRQKHNATAQTSPQRFGPDFPAISETFMPNKSADLLRYRYKVSSCGVFHQLKQICNSATGEKPSSCGGKPIEDVQGAGGASGFLCWPGAALLITVIAVH
jgi:hypothetical protein